MKEAARSSENTFLSESSACKQGQDAGQPSSTLNGAAPEDQSTSQNEFGLLDYHSMHKCSLLRCELLNFGSDKMLLMAHRCHARPIQQTLDQYTVTDEVMIELDHYFADFLIFVKNRKLRHEDRRVEIELIQQVHSSSPKGPNNETVVHVKSTTTTTTIGALDTELRWFSKDVERIVGNVRERFAALTAEIMELSTSLVATSRPKDAWMPYDCVENFEDLKLEALELEMDLKSEIWMKRADKKTEGRLLWTTWAPAAKPSPGSVGIELPEKRREQPEKALEKPRANSEELVEIQPALIKHTVCDMIEISPPLPDSVQKGLEIVTSGLNNIQHQVGNVIQLLCAHLRADSDLSNRPYTAVQDLEASEEDTPDDDQWSQIHEDVASQHDTENTMRSSSFDISTADEASIESSPKNKTTRKITISEFRDWTLE
jgi:hypothetical protein